MSQPMPERPEIPGHRLESVIGRGGSGVVWRGRDATGRAVAVKVPHGRPDPLAVEQATIERHVLMAVEHEHLVGLRDLVPLGDGRIALVFDLVAGAVLSGLVGRRGHLEPGEVVTVLTPLCEAVTALHAAGGTHGDISAGNVMITEAGLPMLLDLGAARLLGPAAAAGPGAVPDRPVFGTAGFVAPELRRGAAPNARSDVFSLGALAWFCATGNGAPDTEQRLDLDIVSSHVGHELAAVVAACIDPDPDLRPDCAALARMFYDASRPEPVEVVVGGDDAAALTHRLRAQAAGDPPVTVPEPGWRSAVRSGRARVAALFDPGRAPGDRIDAVAVKPVTAPPRPTPSRGPRPRLLVLSLVCLGLVLGGAAVVKAAAADAPATTATTATTATADPADPTTPVTAGLAAGATAPATTTATTTATKTKPDGAGPDVRSDRRAPQTKAKALVAALSLLRAEALSKQNRALLAEVHRTESSSWSADEKLVDSLTSGHLRWESLHPSVLSASLVHQTSGRAVVRARVAWAAYELVASDGTRQLRPADTGDTLDFTLVWLPQGWRLESLSAPPAT